MRVPNWLPERFYRDIWLFVITGMVALALLNQQGTLDQIQQSRVEIARESCQAQNDRHGDSIRRLDDAIAVLPPGPRKERAERNRKFTVSLIDALAPKRDCKALVEQIRSAG